MRLIQRQCPPALPAVKACVVVGFIFPATTLALPSRFVAATRHATKLAPKGNRHETERTLKNLYFVLCFSVFVGGTWSGGGAASFVPALPNGVAAGDVSSSSVVLWTRSTNLGPVTFSCSTDSNFNSIFKSMAAPAADPALPVKVEMTGLTPGTPYFYRVTDSAGNSLNGRFRTPQPDAQCGGLRFGVSGDWRGELAPYPSIANAPGRDLDFFVELGDTIYADYPSAAVPSAQAKTLAEFRAKHNEVYSGPFGLNAWADLRASTAIFAVIDDHEVSNNFAGGADPGSAARVNPAGPFFNETPLYQTALQAFQEYNPIRQLVYDTPNDPRTDGKPKLYRTQRFGREAGIFLLDARSFRDKPLPEVTNLLDSAEVSAFNSLSFDIDPKTSAKLSRRTLLGARQFADLKADLAAAELGGVLWKFVLVPEPIQNFGVADGPDRFEGYATERTELLKFIADQEIENVVFISADIHGTVANNVNYQLGPAQPYLPTSAFEVVTGPVAFDKPFGPTAFDAAEKVDPLPGLNLLKLLLGTVGITNRQEFEALPRAEKDRLFRMIMDFQLNFIGLDPTGLEGSEIAATLMEGNYVAVHSYGWTEFEIAAESQALTVTTYGIEPYSATEVDATLVQRTPEVVSRFQVLPHADPRSSPALQARPLADRVELSWPAAAGQFVLESAGRLEARTAWSEESERPAVLGDRNVLVVKPSATSRFYRLKKECR